MSELMGFSYGDYLSTDLLFDEDFSDVFQGWAAPEAASGEVTPGTDLQLSDDPANHAG